MKTSEEYLKDISSCLGWCSLWLFFIMLNTCGPELVKIVGDTEVIIHAEPKEGE